jgi:hypothetical protein
MGITGLIIAVFIVIVIIASVTFFVAKKAPEHKTFYWLAIPSLIIAIWALCTSWMWFYYASLYLSLPALIVSVILILIATRFKTDKRLLKITIGVQAGVIVLGFLSALFFGMFT